MWGREGMSKRVRGRDIGGGGWSQGGGGGGGGRGAEVVGKVRVILVRLEL